jgi:hypothetical protein
MGKTLPYYKHFNAHKQNIALLQTFHCSKAEYLTVKQQIIGYQRDHVELPNKQFQFGNCKMETIPVWFRLVRVRVMELP